MIYLLTGSKKERKSFILNTCKEQNLNQDRIVYFYTDDFLDKSFGNIIPYSIGLFDERECLVIIDAVRDLPIKTILENYKNTEHFIFFSEDSILKKDLNAFEKIYAEIKQFKKEKEQKIEKFNTFVLADLLGARDKKNLWLTFRKAIDSGASAEEIHGILFWQLKNLALVKNSSFIPGMNEFVYSKNKSFANNFSIEEIRDLSEKMTEMFHNRDIYSILEIDLEKFILSL